MDFEPNKPGAHYLYSTVSDDLHMYCGNNLVHMYKYTTIDGNLDVGTTGNNSIQVHGTGVAISYSVFITTNGYNF